MIYPSQAEKLPSQTANSFQMDGRQGLHIFFHSSDTRSFLYSLAFFTYGYITNSQRYQLPVGLIAQLVEHYTDIAEVISSIPFQAWSFFFQALISQMLTLCR